MLRALGSLIAFAVSTSPAGAAPAVVGISPALGDTGGGVAVVIEVDDSTGATGASVGGVALTGFAIDDATHVSGVIGAHAAGAVDVTVTNASGTSDPLVGGFEYWHPSVEGPSLLLLPGDYAVTGTQGVDAVGTWQDSSGNNLDAVSASGTNAPAAAAGCPNFVAVDALHLAVPESIADGGTPMATLTAGTIVAILDADVANADDSGAATAYTNGVICAGVNASPSCCFSDAGVKLVAYDEDAGELDYKQSTPAAAATGLGHIAFYRWSGGTIGARVNGGAFGTNTLVAGTLSSGNVGATTEIGRSFGGANYLDGRLKMLAIFAMAKADAVCNKFHVWATGLGLLG